MPDRLRWKLLVRRAEAQRGLGQPEAAARDLDAAARRPHDLILTLTRTRTLTLTLTLTYPYPYTYP